MPIDYATLRFIWWFLLGILLIGFAILDGFDLGVAMLMPVVSRNEGERRVLINTIGPTWEGNQVWFILGGGAIFAAWPLLYAVSFSGFYIAMFVALCGFILRPVSIKYRSKVTDPRWRLTWDSLFTLSGFIPALILGVAVGNVLKGVPFHFDQDLRAFYTGHFWELLNPFALFCGLVSVVMLLQHGALFLATKTEDVIQRRARCTAKIAAVLLMTLFILGGLWVHKGMEGFVLDSTLNPAGPSNPMHKTVITQLGAWTLNFQTWPWLLLIPATGVVGAALSFLLASRGQSKLAFMASGASLFGVIATVGVSMFPILLPSSSDPNQSLTVWDASSSHLTLFVMLVCAVVLLPIVFAYTTWVYRVLRGKVTLDSLLRQDESY